MTTLEELQERLEKLEDERAILELLSRYSFALDAAASDELGDLFTTDAVWEYPFYSGSYFNGGAVSHLQVFRGRKEIVGIMDSVAYQEVKGTCQHFAVGGPRSITITGQTAQCFSYHFAVCSEQADALMPNFQKHTFVLWEFRKDGGTWRISRHERRRMGDPNQAALLHRFPMTAE